MSKLPENQYFPDYAVHPGEILAEEREAYHMQQDELADRLGVARKTVNEIIKGKAPISSDMALKLERVFPQPAHFWLNLQRNYEQTLARLAEQERLRAHLDWLKQIPVTMMVKLGWIAKHKDKTAQLEEVLRFYGIASPEQWQVVWEKHQVAYRQSQRYEACAYAVSAWLRQGEIEAQRIECAPFDKARFTAVLDEIRALTRETPEVFQPRLIELCAAAGVAVVFVPELPKTGVSGATRWNGDKALIQLSLRYKSNDQLWFTFFHEAGHILKHGRKAIFIEGKGLDGEQEAEADAFARDKLIPPATYRHFLSDWDGRSLAPIEHFADDIGIAPGIVVGRLQHEGKLLPGIGNKLKVFYQWKV